MTYISEKLYYSHPFHSQALSCFEKRPDSYLALQRSIAYPEGGGQVGDIGTCIFKGKEFSFSDTKKISGKGRTVICKDFPIINVQGEIQIKISPEDYSFLPDCGEILVNINREYRSALCISHTISHLVYLAMIELRPTVPECTQGCLITHEGGRFDVFVEKYLTEDVNFMTTYVAELLNSKKEIIITEIDGEPECRVWNLGSERIPCGGTHMDFLYPAADVKLKRKGKSRGLERIYYDILNINISPYRDKFIEGIL